MRSWHDNEVAGLAVWQSKLRTDWLFVSKAIGLIGTLSAIVHWFSK